MQSTFGRLLLIPVIAAAASLAAPSAKAETVTVPFSFSASGQIFPAGEYNVDESISPTLVTLRLADSGKAISVPIGTGDVHSKGQGVMLRFRMAGDQHVLDSIEYRGKATGHLGHSRSKASYAHRDKPAHPDSGL